MCTTYCCVCDQPYEPECDDLELCPLCRHLVDLAVGTPRQARARYDRLCRRVRDAGCNATTQDLQQLVEMHQGRLEFLTELLRNQQQMTDISEVVRQSSIKVTRELIAQRQRELSGLTAALAAADQRDASRRESR